MSFYDFLPYGLISLAFSLLLTPWIKVLAKKFGAVQEPPEKVLENIMQLKKEGKISNEVYESKLMAARRRLDKPTSVMWGGIGYVISFLVVSISALLLSKSINIPSNSLNIYIMWFTTIIILFVVGLFDDTIEFSGKVQLTFHIVAALIFVFSPIDISGFRNPFTGAFVNLNLWHFSVNDFLLPISFAFPGDLLIFALALPLMSGLKMQGGIDGLMEGNVAIAALFLFFVSLQYNQPIAALFSIILAGAMFGFLYYNFYPHKLMSGSAGKSVIGFLLAGIIIIGSSKFAMSLIVFTIPLVDLIWVIFRRVLYYKPKNPLQLLLISDKFHFHHRLMKLGYTEVQIVLFEYLYTISFGVLALIAPQFKWIILLSSWTLMSGIIIYANIKSHEA